MTLTPDPPTPVTLDYRTPTPAARAGWVIAVQAVVTALLGFVVAYFAAIAVILLSDPSRGVILPIAAGAAFLALWVYAAVAFMRRPRCRGIGLGLWIAIGSVAIMVLLWFVLSK